jgi:3D (Asp-Asp-Asp) domain-containing protein
MAFFILTGSAGHASAPEFPTYTTSVTGYNAVAAQTDGDPSTTASGALSNTAVVAARSRDLADELPFGTVIAIEPSTERSDTCGLDFVGPKVGYRVIADTMNARITNTVDVLFATDNTFTVGGKAVNAARALGSCKDVTIRVVGHIDISKPSNLPKSQTALAAMVGASGLAVK